MTFRALLLALLVGCNYYEAPATPIADSCSPLSDDEAEAAGVGHYIVGGEMSRSFAATGMLVSSGLCTGTLVAPDLVLTAAHCVERGIGGMQFMLGADLYTPTHTRPVVAAVMHPAYVPPPGGMGTLEQFANDVALVRLGTPIHDVQPVVLHSGNASELLGRPAVFVGYGSIADVMGAGNGSGVRRETTLAFTNLHWSFLLWQNPVTGACRGDSGGPAFVEVNGGWVQVGITSNGPNGCGSGAHQRVDTARSFLEAHGVSFADRPRACGADGVCDGQCPTDADCSGAMCPTGSCPAPAQCVADGICDETCGSADPDCGRDHCADYGLYANGTCDPHCPTPDPDCSAGPSAPPSGCTPTHFRLDPWTGQCSYLDACGVVCGVRLAQCDPYYGCRC